MTESGNIHRLVEGFFRHESGRLVAALTRVFGIRNLDLAEDVVQTSLVEALETWSLGGVPDNPSGWLFRVARNRGLDALRREGNAARLAPDVAALWGDDVVSAFDEFALEGEIPDAQLRMMFACCDPDLPSRSRVALTLNTLCGFSPHEISAAFLSVDEAVRRRLTRARKRLRDRGDVEVPVGEALRPRLDDLHQVLYLLFNEGYNSSHPDQLIRKELCQEAVRLCQLLTQHPVCATPASWALLALMLLHAARFDARVNTDGDVVLLADQDRRRWDRGLIAAGLRALERSACGDDATPYHLEAGIAAHHCLSPSFEQTDWRIILQHYDMLMARSPSPVVELNRAIVLAELRGPDQGLRAIHAITDVDALADYPYLGATLGQLHLAAGDPERARAWFLRAREQTESPTQRHLLDRKLRRTLN
ncbi:MAG: sigma factor [bacterium]|nr:sigma factor [bacterium]